MASERWIESAARGPSKPGTGLFLPGDNAVLDDFAMDPVEAALASRYVRRTRRSALERNELLEALGLPYGLKLTPWPKGMGDAGRAAKCLAEASADAAPEPKPAPTPEPVRHPVPVCPPRARLARRPSNLDKHLEWLDDAECQGEDLVLFFGPDGERQPERDIRERKAKAVCARCYVRPECLDFAVGSPERYGVWGGLNDEERQKERRRRSRRASYESRAAS